MLVQASYEIQTFKKFPSPFGELISKWCILGLRWDRAIIQFPSPFGVLISKSKEICLEAVRQKFPSPFGVLISKSVKTDLGKNELSSRLLSEF